MAMMEKTMATAHRPTANPTPTARSTGRGSFVVEPMTMAKATVLPDLTAVKVAFVGSLSTGKTTLANLFAREWEFPLLPEVAREVAELGFPLDRGATAETETLIFLKQLRAESVHERFVADRSLYDVLAYGDWVIEHADPDRKEDHRWWEARES